MNAWIEAGEVFVVDVREPAEHARERIHGAKLVALSAFDAAAIAPGPGQRLVLYCQSGVRCGMAAEQLANAGHGGHDLSTNWWPA